ncbi:hypothetical protein MYOV003v1_p0057 [Vibrio phage 207E48.1]|nr:hypothetical protein MYOV003v1_p0057 [Vibrio phage 207E48.1]
MRAEKHIQPRYYISLQRLEDIMYQISRRYGLDATDQAKHDIAWGTGSYKTTWLAIQELYDNDYGFFTIHNLQRHHYRDVNYTIKLLQGQRGGKATARGDQFIDIILRAVRSYRQAFVTVNGKHYRHAPSTTRH